MDRMNVEIGVVRPKIVEEKLYIGSLTDTYNPPPNQRSGYDVEINGQNEHGDWNGTSNEKLSKTPHRYID